MIKKDEYLSLENSISAICNFAERYRSETNATPINIYQETGYEKEYCKITQEGIVKILRNNLNIIDEWLRFSQDKRWMPAWFFRKNSKDNWVVGYFSENHEHVYEVRFRDPVDACALMIRMEMEEFRKKCKAESK